MPDRRRQAQAYLEEAETTLSSATVLLEANPEKFDAQIVKGAYDAMEQALSAGIAANGSEIPRRHPGKVQRFFELHDSEELEERVYHWLSRRSRAQYVDFEGTELSTPSDAFDAEDARQVVTDADLVLEFVRERITG